LYYTGQNTESRLVFHPAIIGDPALIECIIQKLAEFYAPKIRRKKFR